MSSYALAGQWKPLCIEGGVCKIDFSPESVGPRFTSQGFLLQYLPIDHSRRNFSRKLVLATPEGITGPSSFGVAYSQDTNTIELPSGKMMYFTRYGVRSWQDLKDELTDTNYSGRDVLNSRMWGEIGPPVIIGDTVYIGLTNFSSLIFFSDDDGVTWNERHTELRIGQDRFNLLKNPEGDTLWAISSEAWDLPGSLWESTDHGDNWVQVDDGSFPANTIRVVHDPINPGRSYALTDYGLFVSLDRGVSWQETEFTEAIHSLLFIERDAGQARVVVIGTDSGVRVSTDEMATWTDTSSGLLSQSHSVNFGDGQLIAASDSGYFSCALMDCIGTAQSLPPEEDRGLVDVVEFYHPDLDHYFMTATDEEATAIDQGAAGPGWIRTGEQFTAWSLGGGGDQRELADVCRFYGSLKPGPNSHFYSASASECKFLMDLQELVPDDKPRWNLEGYAFTVPPAAPDDQLPCPETAIPVYRAYNDGFYRGEDSNHRYMTNPDLMTEMVAKGWIEEGVVFCSPTD